MTADWRAEQEKMRGLSDAMAALDAAKADMLALRDLQGDYAKLTGDMYYTYADDGLDIHFIANGDEIPGGAELSVGYVTKYDDAKNSGFYTERIEGIYTQDPVQHMFWPIFFDTITNSQNNILNDYGYDNP